MYSLLFLPSKYCLDLFGQWFEQPVVRVPPTVGVHVRMARARAGVPLRDGTDCLVAMVVVGFIVVIVLIVILVGCASFR